MRRILLGVSLVVVGFGAAACNDGSAQRSVDTVLAEPAGDPAPRAGGDDGTIKVFDEVGCTGSDGGNQPKVTSPLSIGGSGFDPGETGTMTIETQPGNQVAYEADFTVAADGTFCATPIDLPEGQYKAVFEFGNGTGKQKVFKVEGGAATTTTTTEPESTTTTTEPESTTTTTEPDVTTTTEDIPVPSSTTTTTVATTTTTTIAATTTTEAGSGLPTTTIGGGLPTTTVPGGGTTTVPGGATTTTAVGGGLPTTTGIGGGAATTVPGSTPGTGSSTGYLAVLAGLALLAGIGLVRWTRRPAA